MAQFQLSAYQENILAAISERLESTDKKGLLIEALAGCGKSATLVEIAKHCASLGIKADECKFVVFGKKNKEDLSKKMAQISPQWESSVQTLHSLSYASLRDILGRKASDFSVEGWKYKEIAEDFGFIDSYQGRGKNRQLVNGSLVISGAIEKGSDFVGLLEKLRLHCLDPIVENIADLVIRYKFDFYDLSAIADAAYKCLQKGFHLATDKNLVKLWLDYTDMSWILWGIFNSVKKQDGLDSTALNNCLRRWQFSLKLIAIDEAQDTDNLQLAVLDLLVKNDRNFLIAVGDRFQAVYGFRGCLSDGLDKISERFNCSSLPLPINYRCGKSHLEMVRKIFPEIKIEHHRNAPPGEIRCISEFDFLQIFSNSELGYFGISRKNAPLLSYAIKLLAAGHPAKIKDKGLGDKIIFLVEQICKRTKQKYSKDLFPLQISDYSKSENERLSKYPNGEERIAELSDFLECITALHEHYQPERLSDWSSKIDEIFSESDYSPISLYSIHSGKGGEGEVAFILNPEKMPLQWRDMSAMDIQQESNLIYVALTRVLANQNLGSGILYLVCEGSGNSIKFPRWLPTEYQNQFKFEKESQSEPEIDQILECVEYFQSPISEILPLGEEIEIPPKPEIDPELRELVRALLHLYPKGDLISAIEILSKK